MANNDSNDDDDLIGDDDDGLPSGLSGILPPQAGCCDEAAKWRSAVRRVRREHEITRTEVMDIRHQLYGNGTPGYFEKVRNIEEVLKDQKASRREFRG